MSKEIADMPIEAYHSSQAIGSSGLKLLQRSPLHYWSAYMDPNRESVDKVAYRIGRAWHCAVFEPEHFANRFAANHDAHGATSKAKLMGKLLSGEIKFESLVALPEGLKLTTKEGKALVAELEADGKVPVSDEEYDWHLTWLQKLQGRDILSQDHIDKVMKMAEAMRAHPFINRLFSQYEGKSAVEHSLFDIDPDTGLTVKIRPDYFVFPCAEFPNGLIIDGKSTTDASPDGFGKQVWKLDYGLQAAFYTSVFQRVMKTEGRPAFAWAACEKEAPHGTGVYMAASDLLEYWDEQIAGLLELYLQCLKSNRFDGYPTEVTTLSLPAWAQKSLNDESIEVEYA